MGDLVVRSDDGHTLVVDEILDGVVICTSHSLSPSHPEYGLEPVSVNLPQEARYISDTSLETPVDPIPDPPSSGVGTKLAGAAVAVAGLVGGAAGAALVHLT